MYRQAGYTAEVSIISYVERGFLERDDFVRGILPSRLVCMFVYQSRE